MARDDANSGRGTSPAATARSRDVIGKWLSGPWRRSLIAFAVAPLAMSLASPASAAAGQNPAGSSTGRCLKLPPGLGSPGPNGANPFGEACAAAPLAPIAPSKGGGTTTIAPNSSSGGGWYDRVIRNDLYVGYTRATREHRLLIIFFTAPWCNYCKAMTLETLANPAVLWFMSQGVALELDVERDDQYQNTKQLMNRLDIKEFPAIAIMQVDGPNPGLVGRIIGYHNKRQLGLAFLQTMPKEISERLPFAMPDWNDHDIARPPGQ